MVQKPEGTFFFFFSLKVFIILGICIHVCVYHMRADNADREHFSSIEESQTLIALLANTG